MPTLIAVLVPGGTLGLSVAASLAASLTLFFGWERLYRRNFPVWMIAGLLPALFLVPAIACFASQSLPGVASFSLLALALQRFTRFLVHRDTEAGFVTGLALGGAFLLDPMAPFSALALGLAAAPVALDRFRTEPSAAPATVAVMCPDAVPGARLVVPRVAVRPGRVRHRHHHPGLPGLPRGALGALGDAARAVGAD
jgi:hypothetical protein